MSAIINIIQTYESNGNIESTVVDLCDIMELRCSYPIEDKSDENVDENLPGLKPGQIKQLEISLANGERINIDLTVKTVFRIIDEEGSQKETTNLQTFEESYIKVREIKNANKRVLFK